jgi:CheY-like chemotaxis protein
MAVERLLLIDDSDIDNMVNKKMVEKYGFATNIVVKKSAQAGLDYLMQTLEMDANALPEVIFLDIRMPEIDGFGFLERYEFLDARIRQSCRIVMLSSSIDADDFRRAMENPYVIHFINKPLTQKALDELKDK